MSVSGKIVSIFFMTIMFLFFVGLPLKAGVLLEDDFEYGTPEPYPGDETGCFNSILVTQGPWDEIADSRCHFDKYGQITIVDHSGVPFTDNITGKIPQGSYVLRMITVPHPSGNQCTAHLNKTGLNLGSEFWVYFWVAKARVAGEMSENWDMDIGQGVKFPFLMAHDTPYYSWNTWYNSILHVDWSENQLNSDGADSTYSVVHYHANFSGGACSNGEWNDGAYYNPNLIDNGTISEQYALRPNRWHRVKMHYKYDPNDNHPDSRWEAWIDNRDGTGFHKVAERIGGGAGGNAPCWSDPHFAGDLSWILQAPAAPGSYLPTYLYVDHVVFGEYESDLPGPPPEKPLNLRIINIQP